MPSGIGVEKGEKVKPTPKNLVPGVENKHGFTIPAYNITEVVTRDEPKTVSFVADKAGVFPFSCQLHPAHIGGSLVVPPKKERGYQSPRPLKGGEYVGHRTAGPHARPL